MAVERGFTSAAERQAAVPAELLVQPAGGPVPTWAGGPKRGKAKKQVMATHVESVTGSGYDAARVAAELASAVASFLNAWPSLAGPLVNGLVSDVASLAAGGVGGLASLTAGAAAIAAVGTALGKATRGLAKRSAKRAAGEVSALGVKASEGTADSEALQGQADVTAHLIGQTLAGSATRTALLHVGREADEIAAAVKADLEEIADLRSGGYILQNLESALAAAQGAGRMATFAQVEDKIQLMARESPGACAVCEAEDGKVYASFAAAAKAYPQGRHVGCLGRSNCRGGLQPVVRA
jgi:hypothetical protein